jgi:hypothetical protein
MTDPNLIYKISEYRMRDKDNLDTYYYFILYLAHILKCIENSIDESISDYGLKTLEFNIMPILYKFRGGEEKVTQSELVQFCLYMTNCHKICNKMLKVISLYNQHTDAFKYHTKLPDCVLNDFNSFETRINNLAPKFQQIQEEYDDCLQGKYKTIYNKNKLDSFITV